MLIVNFFKKQGEFKLMLFELYSKYFAKLPDPLDWLPCLYEISSRQIRDGSLLQTRQHTYKQSIESPLALLIRCVPIPLKVGLAQHCLNHRDLVVLKSRLGWIFSLELCSRILTSFTNNIHVLMQPVYTCAIARISLQGRFF